MPRGMLVMFLDQSICKNFDCVIEHNYRTRAVQLQYVILKKRNKNAILHAEHSAFKLSFVFMINLTLTSK